MGKLRTLGLNDTRADLAALTAPGAAWEVEDRSLEDVEFKNVPVEDAALAEIGERSVSQVVGAELLARLRELRDAAPSPPDPPELPQAPFKRHVFLSYARSDAEMAAALRAALEADGVTVWQDVDMAVGRRFRGEIDAKIDGAEAVVTLWSPDAVASDHVISEAERARLSDKFFPALIAPADPPRPFDVFNMADLTAWDGDREHPEYQKLLWSLRERLTPGAPVGVTVKDSAMAPTQNPPDASPINPDAAAKDRALRAQAARARTFLEETEGASNIHPRLNPRLTRYADELETKDPIWETVDDYFDLAVQLMKEEEVDDGLASLLRRLRAGHEALEGFLDKEGRNPPPETAPEMDQKDAMAAAQAVEDAAAVIEAARLGPALPDYLRERAKSFRAGAEGPDGPELEQEEAHRAWLGRTGYTTLGVLSAAGSAASIAALGLTPGAMAQLGRGLDDADAAFEFGLATAKFGGGSVRSSLPPKPH